MKKISKIFQAAFLILIAVVLFHYGKSYSLNLNNIYQNEILSDIIYYIETEYVNPNPDTEKMLEGAINGMLKSLDPNSRYINPEKAKQEQEDMAGKYFGIGAELGEKYSAIVIMGIYENSPAEKSGLKIDDIIIKVNGESIRGLSVDEVAKKIRGPKNTSVAITIIRKNYPEPLTIKVIRSEIKIVNIKAIKINNILYIRMASFNKTAAKDLFSEIDKYISKIQNPRLILDLRNNPGGLLDVTIKIAEEFLSKNSIILITKNRHKEYLYISKKNGKYANIPLVLLVNHYSASASEILGASLLENNRAKLIGIQTFGKGTVQQQISLRNGGVLYLTIAEFFSPKYNAINKIGITPNYIVHLKEKDKIGDPVNDSQLQKAIELLSK